MKKHDPPISLVTTSFKIPDKDILQIAYELRADHCKKFGDEPIGWIISAQDYLCLIERLKSSSYYASRYEVMYPKEFMGLPIRLKRTGPLELEIPIEQWHRFAMGEIR